MFLKGAPEIVIDYCTKYYDINGDSHELTSEVKSEILGAKVT